MVGGMNILVLSDNVEILERAKPIFEKRTVNWTFTNSDDINPKKDFQHIIDNHDLVFSLHCKKIFPKILTDSVSCINIHPGYNPYNRGMFPHVFSILNGQPAGATIHEMTAKIDEGPIICQRQVPVYDRDTSGTLYEKVISCELELLDNYLDLIIEQKYVTHREIGYGNYNSMVDFKRLCKIYPDADISPGKLFRTLRALSHDGYYNAEMNGIKFKLIIDGNQNS